MSIYSMVRFDQKSRIEFSLDADLVHLPDQEFDFVLAIVKAFREFEKKRGESGDAPEHETAMLYPETAEIRK